MKQREWSRATVEEIPVGKIIVGIRRRDHAKGIAKFAKKIEKEGLLNPIIVNEENVLVCGERRLEAVKHLRWQKIPARRFENLSQDELRMMERSENTSRVDFTPLELSKKIVEEAEAEGEKPVQPEQVSKGGRGKKGGTSAQAEAAGIPTSTLRRAKKHVEAAEKMPVFQGKDWTKGQVLETAERLDKMPEKARDLAADMISEAGIPVKVAVQMVDNLKSMSAPALKNIESLYRSDDEEDNSLAKTTAAKKPPMPPHRLKWLRDVVKLLEKVNDDPHDIAKADLRSALTSIKSALKESEEFHKMRRKKAGF